MARTLASIIVSLERVRDDLQSNELNDCIYDLLNWGIEHGIDLESQKENFEDALVRPRRIL